MLLGRGGCPSIAPAPLFHIACGSLAAPKQSGCARCMGATQSKPYRWSTGGSRSAWWAQLLADTLGVELLIQASARHAAALGAARLAMLCVGQDVNAVCQTPAIEQRYAPEPERRDKLATRYQRFKTLQASLSATFTER